MVLENTLELIGNTPVVKMNRIAEGCAASVYAKIEKNNLSGSLKDRAALQMIRDLFDQGKLHRGDTIIEPIPVFPEVGSMIVSPRCSFP